MQSDPRQSQLGPRPCADCGETFNAPPAVLWCMACGKKQVIALYARTRGVTEAFATHILDESPELYEEFFSEEMGGIAPPYASDMEDLSNYTLGIPTWTRT